MRCWKTNNGNCLLICLISDFNFALYTRSYSLSQAIAGSKFIYSRARSKRVMNQTMSDVLDPLVVHVLLLTLIIFASSFLVSSV